MTEAISNDTNNFVRSSVTLGLRQDGRQMLEMRQMRIVFNKDKDGVEVALGKTIVFAKISSKIIEPAKNKPSEGKMRFIVNLRVTQDTKQGFKSQKPATLATEINKVLERSIKGSKALDCDSLCILTGKYAWDVQCELSLINNDGNLLDAFNFAAIIALHRYRLPFVTVEGGKLKIWREDQKRPQTLSIHHWPIMMSFGVLNEQESTADGDGISEYVVYDPTKLEEECLNGRISIIMNVYKDLCGIHFPGGSSIPHNILESLIKFCGVKAKEITHTLRNYLKQEDENSMKMFRQEGKIEINMNENLLMTTNSAVFTSKVNNADGDQKGGDPSDQQNGKDEDFRMKFDKEDGAMVEDDDDEEGSEEEALDEENLEELKRMVENL